MDTERITYLYRQHLSQALTMEESQELKAFASNPEFKSILTELTDGLWNPEDLETPEMDIHKADSIYVNIVTQTQLKKAIKLWPRITAAAVIILIIAAGLFYYNESSTIQSTKYANDIAPGKSGATLTLGNGKKIRLSDAVNGELAKEAGVVITKAANGQLAYEIKDQNIVETGIINTLSTARGETYQVKLPDGTSIWLNAGSTLKYPASFANLKSRNVELIGEAYFEVYKDKTHPFILESKGQQVEVLGTHFNVSAYPDEAAIKTTLVEGSVKVRINHIERLLKPNQQSTFKGNGIEVSDVNAKYAVAWKDGFFLFDGETLEEIMTKVSRWYNVKVEYTDPALKSETFICTISRFEKMSKVLNMLQRTGVAIFDIEGNKIIVNKKK